MLRIYSGVFGRGAGLQFGRGAAVWEGRGGMGKKKKEKQRKRVSADGCI